MFENLSSSEWLLYISEWQHQTQNISNIRVTTKVAVHSLLSNLIDLQIRGAAIIHNLACKEVKTVVCILPIRLTISHSVCFCFNSHQPLCYAFYFYTKRKKKKAEKGTNFSVYNSKVKIRLCYLQCRLTNAFAINFEQGNNEGDAFTILANRSAAFINNKSVVLVKHNGGS